MNIRISFKFLLSFAVNYNDCLIKVYFSCGTSLTRQTSMVRRLINFCIIFTIWQRSYVQDHLFSHAHHDYGVVSVALGTQTA